MYCLAHSGSLPHVRHSPGFKIPSSLGMEGKGEGGREGGRERGGGEREGEGERESVYTYYVNSVLYFSLLSLMSGRIPSLKDETGAVSSPHYAHV